MANSWRIAVTVFLFAAQAVLLVVYLRGEPIQNVSEVQEITTDQASQTILKRIKRKLNIAVVSITTEYTDDEV